MSIATADNFKPTNPKPFSEWDLYPIGDGTYRHWASTSEVTSYFAGAGMSPSWAKYKFFWIAGVYTFYTGTEFIPIGAPGNIKGIAMTGTVPQTGATPTSQYIYFAGPGTFNNFPDADNNPIILSENLNVISWDGTMATVQPVPITVDTSNLVNKTTDITIVSTPELFNAANVESGKMDPTTFELASDPTYTRSKPILVDPSTLYNFSGFGTIHYGIIIRFENENGDYIAGSGSVATVDAPEFSVTSPAYSNPLYIRFICKTAKPGDNTVLANISLKKAGIESKVTRILNTKLYSELAVNLDQLTYVDNIGKNKFPIGKSLKGYYDPTTFVFVSNPLYRCIPLIGVPSSAYTTISGLSSTHWALGIAFFKADGSPCTQKGVLSPVDVTEFTFLTPSDCAFVGYTWLTSKTGDNATEETQQIEIGDDATEYEAPKKGINAINEIGDDDIIEYPIVANYAPTTAVKPNDAVSKGYLDARMIGSRYILLIAKTGLILGDSITETLNINGAARSNWPIFFKKITGADYHNYAKSGASFANFDYEYPEQQISVQIQHAIDAGENPDFIIISIGTNDFARSHGDYATAMSKATIGDLDLTLSVEAARYAFWTCRAQWPNAPCFYVMPIQRASLDIFDQPVYDDFRRMAERYGFIVIETGKECGIVRDFEVTGAEGRDLIDGLHPKVPGQIKMANCIAMNVSDKYMPYQ